MSELDARFQKAVAFVRNGPANPNATNDHKLAVYALYKQATEGNVQGAQPWAVQFEARAKWDAWKAVEGLSSDEAKEAYIAKVAELSPDWESA
jgi:diazepam-binding inhibitor (GABA receptor modulator, acyl-CoA-binding protein)